MIWCPSLYSFYLYYYPSVSTLSSLVVKLGFQAWSVIGLTLWDRPSQVTGEKRSSLLSSHRALIAGPACACHRKASVFSCSNMYSGIQWFPRLQWLFLFWLVLQMFRFLSSILWECGFLVQGDTHVSCSLSNLTTFISEEQYAAISCQEICASV